MTTKFETGNIYRMTFIGDSNLKADFICVNRTEKTVTFERFKNSKEVLKRKINNYNGVEFIKEGNYSMAPTIYANKIVG